MDRDYAAANRERAKLKSREWAAANPERKRQQDSAYRKENAEKRALKSAQWRAENYDAIQARKEQYRASHREEIRARDSAWRRANPGIVLADRTLRKARKRQACPKWLTTAQKQAISSFYQTAARLQEATGIAHHVDHIVPIRGEMVCGLHVPWNLQILTAVENLKKGNR